MTAFVGANRYKAPYSGEDGNRTHVHGYFKLPAAAAAADTVDLALIPAGMKVHEVQSAWSAMGGSGTTYSLGWKYEDGSAGGSATAFHAATASVSAGTVNNPILPIGPFTKPAILYATLGTGIAASASEMSSSVVGEFVGTM